MPRIEPARYREKGLRRQELVGELVRRPFRNGLKGRVKWH
ncbi:hypothetical protein C791_0275 [Amycolatopsis azurea DSM 43854]|uniref:Uncharacterized protein n=1 Tax=Amycolatopsis azurea DSM 43854 TaxID=1238180 RepID=M2QPP4_9PSEU|nr:hypothetical protein C791_0275 [Amycolatopsis azurea DSM 43854]